MLQRLQSYPVSLLSLNHLHVSNAFVFYAIQISIFIHRKYCYFRGSARKESNKFITSNLTELIDVNRECDNLFFYLFMQISRSLSAQSKVPFTEKTRHLSKYISGMADRVIKQAGRSKIAYSGPSVV